MSPLQQQLHHSHQLLQRLAQHLYKTILHFHHLSHNLHEGYVTDGGSGVLSYKDVVPIAGVIGDYGAIAVAKDSPFQNFKDVVAAYKKDPSSVKMAGGSVRGSMDHLIGALAFQEQELIQTK